MLTEEQLINEIRKALMNEDIDQTASPENTVEWDSLGHLSILTAVDKLTGGEASKISGLSNIKSLQDLIDILKAESLLS